LEIGMEVSAKYKGAFCEAKISGFNSKEIKCRVSFKDGLGNRTISHEFIKTEVKGATLEKGMNVKANHPDKDEYYDAVINEIIDQSIYNVIFSDGDSGTMKRNNLKIATEKVKPKEDEPREKIVKEEDTENKKDTPTGRELRRTRRQPIIETKVDEDVKKVKQKKRKKILEVVSTLLKKGTKKDIEEDQKSSKAEAHIINRDTGDQSVDTTDELILDTINQFEANLAAFSAEKQSMDIKDTNNIDSSATKLPNNIRHEKSNKRRGLKQLRKESDTILKSGKSTLKDKKKRIKSRNRSDSYKQEKDIKDIKIKSNHRIIQKKKVQKNSENSLQSNKSSSKSNSRISKAKKKKGKTKGLHSESNNFNTEWTCTICTLVNSKEEELCSRCMKMRPNDNLICID